MVAIGGLSISEVERALSAALTGSLRCPAAARTAFIAHTLRGDKAAAAALVNDTGRLTQPADLDAEVARLAALSKEAVNCAARQTDQPLERIADHILRASGKPGLRLQGDPEPEPEATLPAAGDAFAIAAKAAVAITRTTGSSGESSKDSLPQQQQPFAATAPAADNKPFAPTLGTSNSVVGASVVSAFADKAAERMAKQVDEDFIAEVMRAGDAAATDTAKS